MGEVGSYNEKEGWAVMVSEFNCSKFSKNSVSRDDTCAMFIHGGGSVFCFEALKPVVSLWE